jgi:hypothetical protein
MRQILFVLALLGAVLAGWIPAMAATMTVAQPASMHAMHAMAGETGGEAEGKGTAKPMAHPVACAACFAIEAERLEAPGRISTLSSRLPAVTPQLAGLALRPLNPPPRF